MKKQSLESKFQAWFLDLINSNGGYARNIHGNMYQSGIPDVAVTSIHGVTFFVELKMWRYVNPPAKPKDIYKLLRPNQKLFINHVTERGGYSPVIALSENGKLMYYTDGTEVIATHPEVIIRYMINIKHGDFT